MASLNDDASDDDSDDVADDVFDAVDKIVDVKNDDEVDDDVSPREPAGGEVQHEVGGRGGVYHGVKGGTHCREVG